MPFSADDEAKRKMLTEAHNPPLFTAQETADILGISLHTLREIAKKDDWAVYHIGGPFHKANCYAQADVEVAKAVLEANGGRWPPTGSQFTGLSPRELRMRAEKRDAARLDNNRCAIEQRSDSFNEFNLIEQEAFVADIVDRDNPAPRLLSARYDLSQFMTAVRDFVPPRHQAKVMNRVSLYYHHTRNFSYLRPTITVRVIAELLGIELKPIKKR